MFRSSLRRLGNPASALKTTSIVSQTRLPLRQINTRSSFVALQSRIASRNSSVGFRFYSTESTATAEGAEEADAHQIDSFKELGSIGVHSTLTDNIVNGMGYDQMTPVQAKTINPALKGTDIVAQAKTGTGKTLAFLLPLINRMIQEDPSLANRRAVYNAQSNDIRGIVLSPTRELAEQIATEARRLVKGTGVVVQVAVGGTSKARMLRETQSRGCHLLVATPGRLNDLLTDQYAGIAAPNLAAFVLDEADRMLDVGFEKELNQILEVLPSTSEKQRQTILVSATIPDNVIRLARNMVRANDFQFVQTIAENESLTHDKVPQKVVQISSWTNVLPSLFELVDREAAQALAKPDARPFKGIAYFNTTAMVELSGAIGLTRKRNNREQIPVFSISSRLTQDQRTRAADMFRKSKTGLLISSDVTARGMDFPDVTHVIQVDTPRSREDYVHRLGRTGRQGKEGEGWLLLPPGAVGPCRRMLAGLPIQPDNSINSAEVDLAAQAEEDVPEYHEQLKGLYAEMPKKMLGSAYTSLFGVANDKATLAQDLGTWATLGWGWEAPPPVSSKFAFQMGIDPSLLNIEGPQSRFGGGGGGDRYGGRDDSRGRPGGFRRGGDRGGRSSDPFDKMSQSIRRDGPPRRSGRGFGGQGSW